MRPVGLVLTTHHGGSVCLVLVKLHLWLVHEVASVVKVINELDVEVNSVLLEVALAEKAGFFVCNGPAVDRQ